MFSARSRHFQACFLLACLVFALPLVFTVRSSFGQLEFPEGWDGDSTLRDIHFVDLDIGWAVGDRGTILRTEDGGRTWVSFTAPRDMRWNDVFFLNEQVGWIAGGFYRGVLQRSVGVVIETRDGGKTWKNVSRSGIAQIKQIKFFDESNGWMVCDPNQVFPTGMMVTKDGGATWQSAPKISGSPIVIADAANPHVVFGVDSKRRFVNSMQPNKATQSVEYVNDVFVERSGFAVRAGGCGRVECSLDMTNWSQRKLPAELNEYEWNSITMYGHNIWMVGSPGCLVAHSEDHGKSWKTYRTSETTPLHSVFFLNADRGWAVGDLGKIMSTKDGGKTWVSQRNFDKRLAVLNVASSKETAAMDAIGLLSGSFGNIGGVELLVSDRSERSTPLFEQAMNRVGGSTVGQIRCSSDANEHRNLVRTIRHWRPSIIIVNRDDKKLITKVASAIDLAAKETAFPQHAEWGLHAWKVEKVVAVGDALLSDHVVALDQFSATLGRPVSQQIQFAKMLLGVRAAQQPAKEKLGWNLVKTSLAETVAEKGLTTGTRCKYDPACNRQRKKLEIDNMQSLQTISKQKQNIERLLQFNVNSPLDETSWLEAVSAAMSGLDETSQALFLKELATEYTEIGKPDMADMAERNVVQRVPLSEVADESLSKLVDRYSSYESIHLLKGVLKSKINQQPETRIWDPKVAQAGFNDPVLGDSKIDENKITNASILKEAFTHSSSAKKGLGSNVRIYAGEDRENLLAAKTEFQLELTQQLTRSTIQNSVVLMDKFQNQFPAISNKPRFEFRAARIQSLAGNRAAMDRLIDNMTTKPTERNAWLHRIYRERQLQKLELQEDILHLPCVKVTNSKIVLDGFFNDEAWLAMEGQQVKLSGGRAADAAKGANSALRFAYDEEYLYVAIRQRRNETRRLSIPPARSRDEDLTGFSRIEIQIDVDRDYASAYQFVVDERGCCHDSVWRDPQTNDPFFNPTWYIASTRSDSFWTAEIAIPLVELVDPMSEGAHIGKGTAWIVDAKVKRAGEPSDLLFAPELSREQLLLFR